MTKHSQLTPKRRLFVRVARQPREAVTMERENEVKARAQAARELEEMQRGRPLRPPGR